MMSVKRFVVPVALVLAVIAVLLAGWMLMRSSQEPTATGAQTAGDQVRQQCV
jgi:multidrug resistance efflux pump